MKFTFSFIITLLIAVSGYSQQLSDYKYIIVPEQFQFFNEPNKYSLNVATKQQLNKYGFKAFLGNKNLPFNINENICDVLKLKVQNNSGLLRTKIKFVLEDCEGKTVFISKEGTSKAKEYNIAYSEAFREALRSFEGLTIKNNRKKEQTQNVNIVSEENSSSTKTSIDKKSKKENIRSKTKNEVALKVNPKPSSNTQKLVYKSSDGFYKMIQEGNTLVFFEEQKEIGTASAVANTHFPVETSEFKGTGYFNDGNFIIDRIVKGVGKVQMKFLKK